jgi:uncharacterized protein (TIGR02646 family)
MKHIIKSIEPQELTDFKALASPDWIPTYGGLTTVAKNAIKEALMKEQGYICCYCERELTENDSHIEHFKPQHDVTVDPLDFSNMLCSCQKNLKKGDPRHCGNLKNKWFHATSLVSPFNSACENKFGFKGDGTIYPIENALDAETTIEKLGLNIEKLNALRKSVIEPFLDDILTDAEFISFVSGYLQADATGKYGQFQTTIKYLFTRAAA